MGKGVRKQPATADAAEASTTSSETTASPGSDARASLDKWLADVDEVLEGDQ